MLEWKKAMRMESVLVYSSVRMMEVMLDMQLVHLQQKLCSERCMSMIHSSLDIAVMTDMLPNCIQFAYRNIDS